MEDEMTNIENLIDQLIEREGGYVNHHADRGGPTNWGVTQAVARVQGYDGSMRDMPRAIAARIYRRIYWEPPGLERIAQLSSPVAAEMFDTGVNMGPLVAIGFLQRALNALNREQRDYRDLVVDRKIGPATLEALQKFLRLRGKEGESVLLKAVEALQGEHYIALAEGRRANEAFLFGWIANRIG
jgi:lysozyme family protein